MPGDGTDIFSLQRTEMNKTTPLQPLAVNDANVHHYDTHEYIPCEYHSLPVQFDVRLLIAAVATTMMRAYPRFRHYWSALGFSRILLSDVSADTCAHLFWLTFRASSEDDLSKLFSMVYTEVGSRPLLPLDFQNAPTTDELLNFLALDYFGLFSATPVAHKTRLAQVQSLVYSRVVYTAFCLCFPRNAASFDKKWRSTLLTATASLFGADTPTVANDFLTDRLAAPASIPSPSAATHGLPSATGPIRRQSLAASSRRSSHASQPRTRDESLGAYEARAQALRLGPLARSQLKQKPTEGDKPIGVTGPLDFQLGFRVDELEQHRELLGPAFRLDAIIQLQVRARPEASQLMETSPTPLHFDTGMGGSSLELDGRTPLLGRAMRLHHLEVSESRHMPLTTPRPPRTGLRRAAEACLAESDEVLAKHVETRGAFVAEIAASRRELETELDRLDRERNYLVQTKGIERVGLAIVRLKAAQRNGLNQQELQIH